MTLHKPSTWPPLAQILSIAAVTIGLLTTVITLARTIATKAEAQEIAQAQVEQRAKAIESVILQQAKIIARNDIVRERGELRFRQKQLNDDIEQLKQKAPLDADQQYDLEQMRTEARRINARLEELDAALTKSD